MSRPHDTIPNTYRDVPIDQPPPGHSISEASNAELRAAGFHGDAPDEPVERDPGQPPLDELLVAGQTVNIDMNAAAVLLAEARFRVLRDPEGQIVATWDEGRWWTPTESDAFTAALVAELEAEQ